MRIVEPRFPLDVGLLDFRHSDALIRAGYEQSRAALAMPDASAADQTVATCTQPA
jgi:hypothetical protein